MFFEHQQFHIWSLRLQFSKVTALALQFNKTKLLNKK